MNDVVKYRKMILIAIRNMVGAYELFDNGEIDETVLRNFLATHSGFILQKAKRNKSPNSAIRIAVPDLPAITRK